MSEYIEIETEIGDNGRIYMTTNLPLSEEPETYDSLEAMEEGSPVVQALSVVEGIQSLHISQHDLMIVADPAVGVHVVVAEVTAVLKDFFL
ncbi:MAG: hypothetical protein H6658_10340 [Ardenticatenaceae bacterium]|nr:hypothetical protein [Ardenticatenaceae bacterium]